MAMKTWVLALLVGTSACSEAMIEFEPPRGFAYADGDWRVTHYKGANNVGLKILAFENVQGGTLGYWSGDLERKLIARGYTLRSSSEVRGDRRIRGRRWDFEIELDGEPNFLVIGLFVTDDYRYVVQLAGAREHYPVQSEAVPEILAGLELHGCHLRNSICRQAS